MTKSNLFTVAALFVLLFVGVLEANEKSRLHQFGDFLQSKNSFKKSVDSMRVTRWLVPPSGPSRKEPPVTNRANINLWSPSQRLVFGMLPKNVPIPPMEPTGKETPLNPPKNMF